METKQFSATWKGSAQVRKQHKYRYNAPLHVKQKMLHVHLSPELRKKYGMRSVQVRKGDKVKVLRGEWKKTEGKIERVNLKKEKVFVTGVEFIKKDGTKGLLALTPSNLMIIDVELSDKKRKQKLERKKQEKAQEKPTSGEQKKPRLEK